MINTKNDETNNYISPYAPVLSTSKGIDSELIRRISSSQSGSGTPNKKNIKPSTTLLSVEPKTKSTETTATALEGTTTTSTLKLLKEKNNPLYNSSSFEDNNKNVTKTTTKITNNINKDNIIENKKTIDNDDNNNSFLKETTTTPSLNKTIFNNSPERLKSTSTERLNTNTNTNNMTNTSTTTIKLNFNRKEKQEISLMDNNSMQTFHHHQQQEQEETLSQLRKQLHALFIHCKVPEFYSEEFYNAIGLGTRKEAEEKHSSPKPMSASPKEITITRISLDYMNKEINKLKSKQSHFQLISKTIQAREGCLKQIEEKSLNKLEQVNKTVIAGGLNNVVVHEPNLNDIDIMDNISSSSAPFDSKTLELLKTFKEEIEHYRCLTSLVIRQIKEWKDEIEEIVARNNRLKEIAEKKRQEAELKRREKYYTDAGITVGVKGIGMGVDMGVTTISSFNSTQRLHPPITANPQFIYRGKDYLETLLNDNIFIFGSFLSEYVKFSNKNDPFIMRPGFEKNSKKKTEHSNQEEQEQENNNEELKQLITVTTNLLKQLFAFSEEQSEEYTILLNYLAEEKVRYLKQKVMLKKYQLLEKELEIRRIYQQKLQEKEEKKQQSLLKMKESQQSLSSSSAAWQLPVIAAVSTAKEQQQELQKEGSNKGGKNNENEKAHDNDNESRDKSKSLSNLSNREERYKMFFQALSPQSKKRKSANKQNKKLSKNEEQPQSVQKKEENPYLHQKLLLEQVEESDNESVEFVEEEDEGPQSSSSRRPLHLDNKYQPYYFNDSNALLIGDDFTRYQRKRELELLAILQQQHNSQNSVMNRTKLGLRKSSKSSKKELGNNSMLSSGNMNNSNNLIFKKSLLNEQQPGESSLAASENTEKFISTIKKGSSGNEKLFQSSSSSSFREFPFDKTFQQHSPMKSPRMVNVESLSKSIENPNLKPKSNLNIEKIPSSSTLLRLSQSQTSSISKKSKHNLLYLSEELDDVIDSLEDVFSEVMRLDNYKLQYKEKKEKKSMNMLKMKTTQSGGNNLLNNDDGSGYMIEGNIESKEIEKEDKGKGLSQDGEENREQFLKGEEHQNQKEQQQEQQQHEHEQEQQEQQQQQQEEIEKSLSKSLLLTKPPSQTLSLLEQNNLKINKMKTEILNEIYTSTKEKEKLLCAKRVENERMQQLMQERIDNWIVNNAIKAKAKLKGENVNEKASAQQRLQHSKDKDKAEADLTELELELKKELELKMLREVHAEMKKNKDEQDLELMRLREYEMREEEFKQIREREERERRFAEIESEERAKAMAKMLELDEQRKREIEKEMEQAILQEKERLELFAIKKRQEVESEMKQHMRENILDELKKEADLLEEEQKEMLEKEKEEQDAIKNKEDQYRIQIREIERQQRKVSEIEKATNRRALRNESDEGIDNVERAKGEKEEENRGEAVVENENKSKNESGDDSEEYEILKPKVIKEAEKLTKEFSSSPKKMRHFVDIKKNPYEKQYFRKIYVTESPSIMDEDDEIENDI